MINLDKDSIIPIPLYHGTDKRLVDMGKKEVVFLREQCSRISAELLEICKRGLEINDIYNDSELGRSLRSLPKEEMELIDSSIHCLIQNNEGNGKYQYGSFYLTSDRYEAQRFAETAYCGGEYCDIVYRLISGVNKLWPGKFRPDAEMQLAIEKMNRLANGKRHPIVYRFENIKWGELLGEDGDPIQEIENEELDHLTFRFRYTGAVHFSSLNVDWENSNNL